VSKLCPQITSYTAADQQKLAVRVWHNPAPIGEVVSLHGIVSHGGWYESSCAELAANGFQVHFLERRGSGLNASKRGDIDAWTTWLSDLTVYLEQLPTDRCRILLGISWGGILATALARHHPELIDALALICPGLYSFKAANAFQRFALRMATSLGLDNLRVKHPLQDPALFTNSHQAQHYIGQDPLALHEITVRFANCNLQLLNEALTAPESIQAPVLLMLAGDDPITDNQSTRSFVARMGSSDQTVIEFPHASHTLEFEDDPSDYFCELTSWCTRIANQSHPHQA
jgi:alpha-beta hydrolase superfamily lysophospholipase